MSNAATRASGMRPLLRDLQLAEYSWERGDTTRYSSNVHLKTQGCYAFELDGSAFSFVLIFWAEV